MHEPAERSISPCADEMISISESIVMNLDNKPIADKPRVMKTKA